MQWEEGDLRGGEKGSGRTGEDTESKKPSTTRLKITTCSRLLKTGCNIVHSCQQYCSALLSLNQPAIKCNNAEQYC